MNIKQEIQKEKGRIYTRQYYWEHRDQCNESTKRWQHENKEKWQQTRKIYRDKNKEKTREYNKQYREENAEHLRKKQKEYRQKNKEKLNQQKRDWYQQNRQRCLEYEKKYRKENLEHIKKRQKQYRQRKEIREKDNARLKEHRKNDPKIRLNHRIANSIRQTLINGKGYRSWQDLVGYTLDDLINHLSKKLPKGYSLEDISKLHIDHIIPISAFNFSKPEHPDFKRCWALNNLQLLPEIENKQKSNKIEKPFQPMLAFQTTSWGRF